MNIKDSKKGNKGQAKTAKPAVSRPRLTGVGDSQIQHRRAQIREAQRAYRGRKDKAIQDLQERFKRLQEANTIITREFSGFLMFFNHLVSLAPTPR